MAMRDERRRTVRLLAPSLQLKLPLYVLLTGAVFVAVMVAVGQAGLMQPMSYLLAEVSPSMAETVELILRDFAVLAGAATLAYVIVVVTLSVVYMKRMVGPPVAFRRQIEALKNGDYRARVKLRDGDAFEEMARDLNELAGLLESSEKRRR
jgi:methyl-accepting chemotaxis protein